mmetsp:Transcript_94685/g.276892  ORF Transcript_94685/g.276892 Transcript_94685/m.276892 type:complete len:144 (-) Transcript_94685:57-488(-)
MLPWLSLRYMAARPTAAFATGCRRGAVRSLANGSFAPDDAGLEPREDGSKECERLFVEVLEHDELRRLEEAKRKVMQANEARYLDVNHHFNVTNIRLEPAPNHYGVHLTYWARCKYKRGARPSWGATRRTIGRLKWLNKASSP